MKKRYAPLLAALAIFAIALPVLAQSTAAEMSIIRARIMAQVELRLAEENEEMRAEQEAERTAIEQAIRTYGLSSNQSERRALIAISGGNVGAGLTTLEERARGRDSQVAASPDPLARQRRAEEWRNIGALAFLDNTERAIQAYENAARFAPDDPQVLDQLAWLYGRQARIPDRTRVAQQLTRLEDPDARVRGFIHLADIHLDASDGDGARPFVDQAVQIAHANNLPQREAMALVMLAACQLLEHDWEDAQSSTEQSLALSRAGGFRQEEEFALYIQGTVHFVRGASSLLGRQRHFQRAERSYEELQTMFDADQDEISRAQLLVRRGHVARLMDDLPLSEQRLREALEILQRLGVRARFGFAQQQLGATLAKEGRVNEALPLFQNAVEIARQTSQPGYEASALYDWAQAEADRNNMPEACRLGRLSAAAFERAPGQQGQAGPVRMLSSLWCASVH